MKKDYLFPHYFKWIGWCLFLPFALAFFVGNVDDDFISFPTLMIYTPPIAVSSEGGLHVGIATEGMFHEICFLAMSIGLLFVSFARERDEDEYVEHLRLHSFVWAIKANTVLLVFGTWFFFGGLYILFVLVLLISLFLIYIVKFQWELHCMRKEIGHEE